MFVRAAVLFVGELDTCIFGTKSPTPSPSACTGAHPFHSATQVSDCPVAKHRDATVSSCIAILCCAWRLHKPGPLLLIAMEGTTLQLDGGHRVRVPVWYLLSSPQSSGAWLLVVRET
jgi:hypothetical protein